MAGRTDGAEGPLPAAMRLHITGILLALACPVCAIGASETQSASPNQPLPGVTVVVDGGAVGLSTSAQTVGDLLALLDISLSHLDRCTPSLDTSLTNGLEVTIERVTCRELVEDALVPARTVVLADRDLPAGFTKILARGRDGRLRRVWRIWEKDGQETTRGIIKERVLAEAKDTVVLRGTYGAPTRGGDWRHPLVMEATAYDPGPRSCGKYASGYTATGARAVKGVVAVDDRVLPMGTRLYIPGYGFAVAADRGSAIKGMRIDLCFATYRQAMQFGRRKVKVYVLD